MIDAAVHYLLQNWQAVMSDWTVQGFGFARLRISPNTRIHVWDSRLRVPGVSDIHDHAQWDFRSRILSGQIVNVRYDITDDPVRSHRMMMGTIVCGLNGGMTTRHDPTEVRLKPRQPEIYLPGQCYSQDAAEIHRTHATDGTITVIEQCRHDTDTARVFWPLGGVWGDAVPRRATEQELRPVIEHALANWMPA